MLFRLLIATVFLFTGLAAAHAQAEDRASAVFAGGCFWCMESPYDKTDGVLSTTSGYIGGASESANYKQVSAGGTGHYEAVKIEYDPSKVSYEKLLSIFWRNIDPFDDRGQFCDKGDQYKAAIFYGSEEEKALAEQSKQAAAEKLGREIVTEILPAQEFYAAEDYHQDYYQKNPLQYKFYRYACGRDGRLEEVWGKETS
jgi:peptide-methionine (S)-S-oxide reductase